MKQYIYLRYALLLLMAFTVLSACQKQEALYQFIEKTKPPVKPPDPPKPPPPLSEDLKNVELIYNGAALKTSMIARKTFGDTKQPNGRYANGFELVLRLDDNEQEYRVQQLKIKLALDENGEPVKGNYIIKNNQVEEGNILDINYYKGQYSDVYTDASFSTGKADFNFNLTLRIEETNKDEHSISGVIDSMKINNIADTSKKITIKEAGFNFYYDFFEVFLNDQLAFESATISEYSSWYPRDMGGETFQVSLAGERLYPASTVTPLKFGTSTFRFFFDKLDANYTGHITLPLSIYSEQIFMINPEEYTAIDNKPLFGIVPSTSFQWKFINAPKINICGGVELTADDVKILNDEYYDYDENPAGVYYPQVFWTNPVFKLKCRFYQKKF